MRQVLFYDDNFYKYRSKVSSPGERQKFSSVSVSEKTLCRVFFPIHSIYWVTGILRSSRRLIVLYLCETRFKDLDDSWIRAIQQIEWIEKKLYTMFFLKQRQKQISVFRRNMIPSNDIYKNCHHKTKLDAFGWIALVLYGCVPNTKNAYISTSTQRILTIFF